MTPWITTDLTRTSNSDSNSSAFCGAVTVLSLSCTPVADRRSPAFFLLYAHSSYLHRQRMPETSSDSFPTHADPLLQRVSQRTKQQGAGGWQVTATATNGSRHSNRNTISQYTQDNRRSNSRETRTRNRNGNGVFTQHIHASTLERRADSTVPPRVEADYYCREACRSCGSWSRKMPRPKYSATTWNPSAATSSRLKNSSCCTAPSSCACRVSSTC